MEGSTTPSISVSTDTVSAQIDCYLSAPAEYDPWHGMRHVPRSDTPVIINGTPSFSGSSTPSSLRAEYGSNVKNQRDKAAL